MANKILIKSSQDAGDGATQLYNGGSDAQKLSVAELALNTVDGILFAGTHASDDAGTLIEATTDVYAQPLVVHNKAQALGTDSDVTFGDIRLDAINLGHASENTLTASGGTLSIEGVPLATAASVTASALGLQVGVSCTAATANRSITGVGCTSGSTAVTCTAAAIQIGDEILAAGTGVPAGAYVATITGGTEGVNVTAFTLSANADDTDSSLTWTLAGIDTASSAWSWSATNGGTLTRGSNMIMTSQWDGITLEDNDVILVKNQTNNPEQNGIYTVTTAPAGNAALVLTRHDDYDLAAEFPNSFTFVEGGTLYADTSWVCTNDGSLTLNTTALTFEQFNAPGNITAGDGVQKSGNTISTDLKSNGGLVIESGEIAVDLAASSITGTLDETDGGTGVTGYTTGDILYASGTDTLTKLAKGTQGHVLKMGASVPAWSSHAGGLSNMVEDLTPQLGADLDTNGYDIQLDADKSISFDGSTAGQTLIGDGDGITYTVPASDTHDFNVTSTGTVLSVGADTLTTRAGAAHTISVGPASGTDVASGALTISAGTATGDEAGGAITLKTGGAAGNAGASATTAVNALVLAAAGGATFLNNVTMNGTLDGVNLNGGSF